MRNREIDNTQDIIDSRDVIARIEELVAELADYDNDEGDLCAHDAMIATKAELDTLLALQSEAESSPDWSHGEALIHEDYFTDYIEELINDCYEMPKVINSGAWPYRHITIDFEAAAKEAKQDYMEVDFDGVTYYIRA